MLNTNQIDVNSSNIGGDFVGRDKHITNNNYSSISPFSSILKEIRENNHSKTDAEFLQELNEFMCAYKGDIIGLRQKLEDGNRIYSLEYAEDQKERYSKMILKSATLPLEQKLHLKLLSSIRSKFQPIYGLISTKCSTSEINEALQKLISEIEIQLEDDPLNINREGIDGIIYYLTGNCFIKWN